MCLTMSTPRAAASIAMAQSAGAFAFRHAPGMRGCSLMQGVAATLEQTPERAGELGPTAFPAVHN